MTALQKSDGQTGFTKGPWQTNGSHVYGSDPDRTLVAQVLSDGGRCLPDRNLIAAAPELANDGRELLDLLCAVAPEYAESTVAANFRATLAKATGA